MRNSGRILAAACALLVAPPAAWSQESSDSSTIDQLFQDAQGDTETQATDASKLLNAFHAQPLSVSASLTAKLGGVVGYKDSGSSSAGISSLAFDATPGLYLVPSFTITSRPDATFRFQTTLYGTIASNFVPTVSEMFFDYTLLDRVYFRVGKHTVSWGVTRLFDAGGDLMSASGSGLDFKANLPLGSGGITGIAFTPAFSSDFSVSNFSWRQMTFGGQGDIPLGRSELILSSSYCNSASLPLRATAALKTSIKGVDLFAEGIGAYDLQSSPAWTGAVAGFYWERSDPSLKFYGEYYFNAADSSYIDHRASLVFGANNIFGSPFNFGIQWAHAFVDNSGIVLPGVTVDLWSHVSLQLGLPFRYGAPGSFYLANLPPSVETTTTVSDVLSWYQRYGIMFRVTLSAGL